MADNEIYYGEMALGRFGSPTRPLIATTSFAPDPSTIRIYRVRTEDERELICVLSGMLDNKPLPAWASDCDLYPSVREWIISVATDLYRDKVNSLANV